MRGDRFGGHGALVLPSVLQAGVHQDQHPVLREHITLFLHNTKLRATFFGRKFIDITFFIRTISEEMFN